jgi:hypothetical protein
MRLELMDEDEGVLFGVMRKLLIACYESEGGLAEVQVLAELPGDAKPRASARGPKQKEAKAQKAPGKKEELRILPRVDQRAVTLGIHHAKYPKRRSLVYSGPKNTPKMGIHQRIHRVFHVVYLTPGIS